MLIPESTYAIGGEMDEIPLNRLSFQNMVKWILVHETRLVCEENDMKTNRKVRRTGSSVERTDKLKVVQAD